MDIRTLFLTYIDDYDRPTNVYYLIIVCLIMTLAVLFITMLHAPTIHPTINIDHSIKQKNESRLHWAIKAAIVAQFRSNPAIIGTIETEKKTEELIADIRCQLSDSPSDVPCRYVVEIQTSKSNKDIIDATTKHLRFGFAVYWVFTTEALDDRRDAEEELTRYMSTTPSLGVASLAEGEITLGSPITWDEFTLPEPWMGRHELYIPTYDRSKAWFDHGDFELNGERVSVYRKPGQGVVYLCRYLEDGQQTLPELAQLRGDELLQRLNDGDMKRVSPVRGPP